MDGRVRRRAASLLVAAALCLVCAPSALAGGLGFGGAEVNLTGLQCTTPGNCTAIGDYYDALGHGQAASWTESGGHWAQGVRLAPPANAATNAFDAYGSGGGITALSCPAARNCSAAGGYLDPAGNLRAVLFEEQNGNWTTVAAKMPSDYFVLAHRSPNPSGAAVISGISCVSAGNCVAVGYYLSNHGAVKSVMFVETHGAWGSATPVAPPAGGATGNYSLSELTAIDCVPSGTCTAVGTYTDGSFNLQGWVVTISAGSVQTSAPLSMPTGPDTPDASPAPQLTSISCSDSQDCAAAGNYSVDYGGQSTGNLEDVLLVEQSGTWTATEAQLPANAVPISTANAQDTSPLSVDCPDLNHCSAVGYYTDSDSNIQGEVIDETGGSWTTAQQVDLPGDAATTSLAQLVLPGPVSCSGVGYCAASSVYVTGIGNFEPLLVFKDGGAWSSTPMQLPSNAGIDQEVGGLAGVSCPPYDPPTVSTYNDCTVLGIYQNHSGGINGFATSQRSSGTWGTPTELAVPGASPDELKLSLASILKPRGYNSHIKRIVKRHGYSFHYNAVQPGTLTIRWTTRRKHHLHLIARAGVHPKGTGEVLAKLRLTAYGRQLLRTVEQLRVTTTVQFKPPAAGAVVVTGTFTLHK